MKISLHLANVAESIFRTLKSGCCLEGGRDFINLAASSVWEDKDPDSHLSKRFPSILPDASTLQMVTTALIDVLDYLYSSMLLNLES
jgi:hypothetical protein